jgi:hypothetical protein
MVSGKVDRHQIPSFNVSFLLQRTKYVTSTLEAKQTKLVNFPQTFRCAKIEAFEKDFQYQAIDRHCSSTVHRRFFVFGELA